MLASSQGKYSIARMLIKHGATVNLLSLSHRAPALFYALAASDFINPCVELLLSQGADPNIMLDPETCAGMSSCALYVCAIPRNHNIALHYLRLMANYAANFSVTDADGNTSLHFAVMDGNHQAVEFLLNIGVNCNAVNTRGDTPLHVCMERFTSFEPSARNRIVQLLVRFNANILLQNNSNVNAFWYFIFKNHSCRIVRHMLQQSHVHWPTVCIRFAVDCIANKIPCDNCTQLLKLRLNDIISTVRFENVQVVTEWSTNLQQDFNADLFAEFVSEELEQEEGNQEHGNHSPVFRPVSPLQGDQSPIFRPASPDVFELPSAQPIQATFEMVQPLGITTQATVRNDEPDVVYMLSDDDDDNSMDDNDNYDLNVGSDDDKEVSRPNVVIYIN